MIHKIEKQVLDDKIIVEVHCSQRKFASHEIKLLTTEKVFDIIKKEYNITNIIKQPNHKVGNSKSQKIRLSGIWEFQLEQEDKPKPKPKTTRKAKQKTNKNTSSIRSRMSKLASTKREQVATESPTE